LRFFQTRFLEDANPIIAALDLNAARKVIYNIDLAEQSNDPKLFKKLQNDIWEFKQTLVVNKSDYLHFGTKRR
jgi:hypothetical protein